jgi:hypothetical protein
MIRSFYATGDSFVFGQELETARLGIVDTAETLFEFNDYKRHNCYTGIIADRLQVSDYTNSACPGGSNERAYRVLITDISNKLQIYKPEEIFVNISLTHESRREFCMDDQGGYYIHLASWEPPRFPQMHNHELWQVITKYFNYDYGNFTFGMMVLLGMQNFLKVNRIPYIITSSMGNFYETEAQKKFIPPALLDQIYSKRYYTDPSFLQFSKQNNCEIGPGLHPLEEGHKMWADHLFSYIENNNLFDNGDL